ncbi:restriction endonuclease subunit S [Pseudomonas aeruginosa]|uniref:restriction endonuclease subunit S n=1 Tax=Pseudomonas aeruginosa TaxID=287 RepID=UPI003A4D264E
MSDSEEVCYRALSELVSQVDAKITVRKDPTRHYVGLENIPSRGAHLTGWSLASSSISTNSIFQSGDVLFGKLRPNLRKCVVAPFDGYCSTDILVLRANTGVDPSFAGKVLRTEQVGAAAEMTSVGTKMPRTSWKHLSELEVFCPGFPEQSKIAKVLDVVDTAIHETGAIISKLKAVKQGLLHDLLTRGIATSGELRPPQAEAPQLYKQSPLGWIPKEWEEVTLGEIARRSGGFLQTGPFGSQLHAHEYVLDGIPVIMPQDMVNGELSVESIARINQRKATALSRHRVQPNDLVFSRRGDLSRCVAIEEEHLGWLCGTGCLLARLPAHEVNGYWLALVYTQPGVQTQVMGRAVGSTMANLNTAILAAITIARPPVTEQNEIAKRLKSLNKRIRFEEEELEKRRFEKTGLMDDLLTGRVRVTALLAEAAQQKGSA